MNPYEVLNVSRNFTLQELKDNYKRIALKVHPDKGGSEQLFLLVTKCFKKLLQEYNRRQSDKQYHELKAEFLKATDDHRERRKHVDMPPAANGSGSSSERFDLDKFNRMFTEHRLDEVTDKGYSRWMNDSAPPDTSSATYKSSKGFKIDSFNKAFETQATIDRNNKYIVKYKEPEPLITTKKISFTELGQEDIDDFSGDNMTKKTLNFMDYKVAHTTSKIVDPRVVQERRTYRNITELEAARSAVSYEMDDETKSEFEYRKKKESMQEQRRQEMLAERDNLIQRHYERVNQLMLGQRR